MVLTTKLGAITVKGSSVLVTPVSVAEISVLPTATPVATPEASIVATVDDDDQATASVMSCVMPSVKVPMASYCPDTPSASFSEPGLTAIDTTESFVRPNVASPEAPEAVATTS